MQFKRFYHSQLALPAANRQRARFVIKLKADSSLHVCFEQQQFAVIPALAVSDVYSSQTTPLVGAGSTTHTI